MKKSIFILLAASAFIVSCSPAVSGCNEPEVRTGVSKYAPVEKLEIVSFDNVVSLTAYHEYDLYTELKGVLPAATVFYLDREFFLGRYADKLPKTFVYCKDRIYLLNCSIRQC